MHDAKDTDDLAISQIVDGVDERVGNVGKHALEGFRDHARPSDGEVAKPFGSAANAKSDALSRRRTFSRHVLDMANQIVDGLVKPANPTAHDLPFVTAASMAASSLSIAVV